MEELGSPAEAEILSVCHNMAARGPAEDGGASNLRCPRVQMRGGGGGGGASERKQQQQQQHREQEKQDRMLIYANAVTQIWKRLVPLVGS